MKVASSHIIDALECGEITS